jgi:tripartite-type tricarboxylate transporter receptor subunit TctC
MRLNARLFWSSLPLLLLTQIVGSSLARADTVASFYKGKTINVVIGYSVGGGYDTYARLLATYLGKHIPGNPTVIPQNMPGAGSLNAANYLGSVAPRDGTVIGTFARGMPIFPLLFKGADYDGSKFGYIGSITKDTSVCLTWRTSKVKNWKDLLSIPSSFGGEGRGSDPDLFATLLKLQFGAKIKLVTGYPGTADISLAVERGELDGLCGISYSSLKATHSDWLKNKDINIVVQAAVKKDPELANVPSLLDLTTTTKQRQIVKFAVAPQALARPFVAPPASPEDRLAALRTAFDETVKDPAFLAAAAKMRLDVNPLAGAEIQVLVKELYATPKDVVKEAAEAMGGGS